MIQLFLQYLLKKPQLLSNLRISCLPDVQISGSFGLNGNFINKELLNSLSKLCLSLRSFANCPAVADKPSATLGSSLLQASLNSEKFWVQGHSCSAAMPVKNHNFHKGIQSGKIFLQDLVFCYQTYFCHIKKSSNSRSYNSSMLHSLRAENSQDSQKC